MHWKATTAFGIKSQRGYQEAMRGLEKKGYLVKRDNPEADGTNYDFYELVEFADDDDVVIQINKE